MTESSPGRSRIEDAINNAGLGWTLCFIGENQSEKLAALIEDLSAGVSETGDGKQFASGFSYWGIGPTCAWASACNDATYRVMQESIRSFSNLWKQTLPTLVGHKFHYVSLGIGTGHKDFHILQDLHRIDPELFYFPVDMSPEMLRVGIPESAKSVPLLERHRLLPVQLDFSIESNVVALRKLLNGIVGEEPILFSLLGNTLANFEGDKDLLKILSNLIRVQDRFLLEVARTDSLEEALQREAVREYKNSTRFKKFVTSAILQNTDLPVDFDSIEFVSEVEQERAIRIKIFYRNQIESKLKMMLPDGTKIVFPKGDTIRLYLTRKYTRKGVDGLIEHCGFTVLDSKESRFPARPGHVNFGMELSLLGLDSGTKDKEVAWEFFLSHAGPDKLVAEELYGLLNSQVRVFLASRTLSPGDPWDSAVAAAQKRSLITIALISSHTEQSHYQREEIATAIALARHSPAKHQVVPILLDSHSGAQSALPFGLRIIHRLEAQEGMAEIAQKLIELIRRAR